MRDSRLPTEHHEALPSTDVEAVRAMSSFAVFAPKFDVLSAPLLAWPIFLQLTIFNQILPLKKVRNVKKLDHLFIQN